ncbi:hypothetical protein [Streptomyces sp. NPDC059781]|uniref:hypothetical protein n=1 Tax=Streptomyces sp. NPDC059781 TaxID=3346943 RepID=UPI0036605A47
MSRPSRIGSRHQPALRFAGAVLHRSSPDHRPPVAGPLAVVDAGHKTGKADGPLSTGLYRALARTTVPGPREAHPVYAAGHSGTVCDRGSVGRGTLGPPGTG